MDGATWGTFAVGGCLAVHSFVGALSSFTGTANTWPDIYPLLWGASRFSWTRWWNIPRTRLAGDLSFHVIGELPGLILSVERITRCGMASTICAGSTIDMQILRDLFGGLYRGREDPGARTRSSAGKSPRTRQRLAPMQIGKRGQLQEWLVDWDDREPRHRHISHLYGLFPSAQITPLFHARAG